MRIKNKIFLFAAALFLSACTRTAPPLSRMEICFFYPDGQLYSISEMNEHLRLDGVLYEYDQTGNLARKIQYKDGLMEGKYLTFFEAGALKSIHKFQKGIPEGHFLWYFPDGAIEQRGIKVNGDTEGRVESYFPDGRLQSFSHFQRGRKTGLTVEYYPEKTIKVHSWYDETGTLIFQQAYLKNGRLEEQFGEPVQISRQDINPENKTLYLEIASGFPRELITDFLVTCIFPDQTAKKIPVVVGQNGTIDWSFSFLNGMMPGAYHFLADLKVSLPDEKTQRVYRKKIKVVLEDEIQVLSI